jgi:import receptor subunit TOM20
MDSSSIRAQTVVALSAGAVVAGALGYAVYFDYKRRTDSEFRRAIKRDAKKQARAQKAKAEESAANMRKEIAQLVRHMNSEGYPSRQDEMEIYFMEQMQKSEALIQSTVDYCHVFEPT